MTMHNRTHTKAWWWKCQISKIQHGGRPPFWKKNHYISISQPQVVPISRNLVRRHKFHPWRWKRDKKSEIPKFKMADVRHIENHFLLITRLHYVQLRRNLVSGGIIARTQRFVMKTSNFENPTRQTAAIFKIIISLNCTKFSMQTQILRQATETTKSRNSQIENGGWTRHWKSLFDYNSAACCPVKIKFEVSRQKHTHMMHVRCLIMKIQNCRRQYFQSGYTSISAPRIVQNWRNMVHKHKFRHNWGNMTNKSEINIKTANIFFLNY